MHIRIDFSNISNQVLRFEIIVTESMQLQLDALTVGNGIAIKNLVSDTKFTVEDNLVLLKEPGRLQYDIYTSYRDAVGDDRDVYVMYPFINQAEVFCGVGAIPYPANYTTIADTFAFSYEFLHLPAGWRVFTNLEPASPSKLEGFFIYLAKDNIETGSFQYKDTIFNWTKQLCKHFPISHDEIKEYVCDYVGWLEQNIGPFLPDTLQLLFLQVPPDFDSISNHRTFATGQNFLNGILTVGPNSPEYLRDLFGYDDYRFFLYDGITHELMHYYTTSSWQGRYKAYLYPTPAASPYTRRLIGEALNNYFHRQYLYQYFFGSKDRFYDVDIVESLQRAKLRGTRAPLADLYLLDTALQEHGTSLLKQFRRLVQAGVGIDTPMALVDGLPQNVGYWVDEHQSPDYSVLQKPKNE